MQLSNWLFGRGQEYRGVLVGVDYSGKSTLVSHMQHKVPKEIIPTIGVRIETMVHPKGSTFQLWEVAGGCSKLQPLTRRWITEDSFTLFVHDCVDHDRTVESLEELQMNLEMMKQAGARYIWIVLNKQDLLPASERDVLVSAIRKRFEEIAAKYANHLCIKIVDLPGFSATSGIQVRALMDEIDGTLRSSSALKREKAAGSMAKTEAEILAPTEEELRGRVKSANAAAESADEFWAAFTSGKLEAWDHYNHLRAGYFVILERFAEGEGIFRCSDAFIEHLERLRGANPQKFRNTTHRTMTVFWVVQLFLSATIYQTENNLPNFPQREEFANVLSHTPYLMNTRLWDTYYSKDLIFSPEAKRTWQVPDLKSFQAIIRRPEQNPSASDPKCELDDTDHLLEFGFTIAQNTLGLGIRRGAVVKPALELLEASTMRFRATKNPIPPYSETKAYFWIQLTYAAMRSLADDENDPSGTAASFRGPVLALTFPAFKEMFGFTGTEWKEYYSSERWNGIAARSMFAVPDLKPLPNVLGATSNSVVRNAREKVVDRTARYSLASYDLPKGETLLIDSADLLASAHAEKWAGPFAAIQAELLFLLYEKLIANDQTSTEEEIVSPQRSEELVRALSAVLQVGRRPMHRKASGGLSGEESDW